MLGIKLLLVLSLVVTVRLQASDVGYYGTSNVRNQGPNLLPMYRPRPLPQPGRPTIQPVAQPRAPPAADDIPKPTSQPELLPDPVSEPTPQPHPSPDVIPEPIPPPETLSDPTPDLHPQPILESGPDPQPIPQPETIPQPELTTKPGSGGIALPPLLPKPKPERPPAFIIRPTYSSYPSEETPKPTDYPTTIPDPPPEPTTETLPPETTTHKPTSTYKPTTTDEPTATYKPSYGGILESGFNCTRGNDYYAVERYCDSYIECKYNIAVRYSCPDGLNFNPITKWNQYPCSYPSEAPCEAGSMIQSPKPTVECPRQYGYFPMKDGECSKYIMCQEGKATVMDCPYGLVFNVETSTCDWPENVPLCNPNAFKDFKCPEPQMNQDGMISDSISKYRYGSQCKLYVACQRGHPRLLSCDQGLLFDEPSQSCIDEELVTNCATAYVF